MIQQKWSKYASVTVTHSGDREVAKYGVRITFFDKTGAMIKDSLGGETFLGHDTNGVKPKKTRTASWSVNRFSWPTERIQTVQAQVIQIQYSDGEQWTHPAYAAGIWK